MERKMYEASNLTRQAICRALKELMAQKPLNKISVTEIMERCGMARQHFYYHFEDIYDAVRWLFEEEAVSLLQEHEGALLWQDGLLQLFQYIQENRAVCLCAYHSLGRQHLKHFFQADVSAVIQSSIEDVVREIDCAPEQVDTALLVKFYVGALVSVLESWLLGEFQETPEELIRFADTLLTDQIAGTSLRLTGKLPDSLPEEE